MPPAPGDTYDDHLADVPTAELYVGRVAHVHQPAAREDAQPDQEDVLDPEAREPALPGEAAHEGSATFRVRRPQASHQPCPVPASGAAPHPGTLWGLLWSPSPLTAQPFQWRWGTGAQTFTHTGGQSQFQNAVIQGSRLYFAEQRHFLHSSLLSCPHVRTGNLRARAATHTDLCSRGGAPAGPGPGQQRGAGLGAHGAEGWARQPWRCASHTRGPSTVLPTAKAGTHLGTTDTGLD